MKRNNLSKTGLSMSQAQSVSNLCNQRAREIEMILSNLNNASKSVTIEGKQYTEVVAKPIPSNVVELLKEKAALHGTQAFLMENINAKDELLKRTASERFIFTTKAPEYPNMETAEVLPTVTEEWGWEQLSANEMAEYYEVEAAAAHIGQFIHKGSPLDKLRKELPHIKTLEFIELEKDKKTPLDIVVHHRSEDLLQLHEELAAIHREKEQRVNYYKAKVKNIVTKENTRIASVNTTAQNEVNERNNGRLAEYRIAEAEYRGQFTEAQKQFEVQRQERIKEESALRIQVDPRFQPIVDQFLPKKEDEQQKAE